MGRASVGGPGVSTLEKAAKKKKTPAGAPGATFWGAMGPFGERAPPKPWGGPCHEGPHVRGALAPVLRLGPHKNKTKEAGLVAAFASDARDQVERKKNSPEGHSEDAFIWGGPGQQKNFSGFRAGGGGGPGFAFFFP